MKTIEKKDLSQQEILDMITQGKDPNEYMALEIVAMGLQMTPNTARVKEYEGSDTSHKCIVCMMPFPLPIARSALNQKKLIVPTMGGQQEGTLELSLAGVPKIRLVMKKNSVVDTLNQDEEK